MNVNNKTGNYHYIVLCIIVCLYVPTTLLHTLSLHDALPISSAVSLSSITMSATPTFAAIRPRPSDQRLVAWRRWVSPTRSEEHTSELQSQFHLVCRILLEKKNI